ncbi:ribonuclease HII [Candidatus Collinsella stercoripullorum]|uniref:ribonuclease HII n=1 Tax=Candidatus Collinsella stercoripullorum TaxID=2838522 RepID=UPI0022E59B4D|nr:ribonuclease HII [Candidatus Collinsella stercoripullorum]
MANMTSSHPASQVAAELASAPPDQIEGLLERYRDDPRAQVRKACERARRRLDRERAERERVEGMYARMRELGGAGVVVGVDEVGRGSVAGPLTVCAVCLPDEPRIWGVNDSKQLSPARREMLAVRIAETARAIGICHIPPERIDAIGMARSLREAVAGAVADTGLAPDCVLMDGNPLGAVPNERDVVHGDATVACIAAASIVAKVTRDELMVELDAEYPGYHLARSKGYASPEHIQAIRERGLTPVHRVSFCGNFLETARLF